MQQEIKCPKCEYLNIRDIKLGSYLHFFNCEKCDVRIEIHLSSLRDKVVYVSCEDETGGIFR